MPVVFHLAAKYRVSDAFLAITVWLWVEQNILKDVTLKIIEIIHEMMHFLYHFMAKATDDQAYFISYRSSIG